MAIEPAAPPHPADTHRPAPAVPTPSDIPARPAQVSQSTAIEQSRAVAEVAAMVQVAQACPRDPQAAIRELRENCGLMIVAERAFYEYKRAGNSIHGPTIHLMTEAARCWRNIKHGVYELSRDLDGRQSECAATAWDLQSNVIVEQRFIVPHYRDRAGKWEPLKELRDVYETTANQGSRRVREAIRKALPAWFVDMAINLAQETLDRGSDAGQKAVPLDVRITDAIDRFDELGIRVGQLEQKADRPRAEWTARTLASLHVTYVSIRRGEITVDDAFPAEAVTGREIVAQHAAVSAPSDVDEPEPPHTPVEERDDQGRLLDPERPFD